MEVKVKLAKSKILEGIRCIISDKDITKDEIIEECPILLLPMPDMQYISKTVMDKYEFVWNEKNDALVLGYGSLYNHSFEPNVRFVRDFENNLMKFIAIRDIAAGEELFINYMQGEDTQSIPNEYVDYSH